MSKRLIPMVARATRTIVRPAAPVAQAAAIRSFSFAAAWPLDGACRKPAASAVAKFAHQGRMLSSMAAVPEDDRKIFVGNLAWRVSSEDLHSHFQQWGQIEDARVIMDRENPFRSRGFGFVTFSRAEDAQSAISMNHDKEWNGRNIRVNLASQPPPRRSE